jgi:hypothetical protein
MNDELKTNDDELKVKMDLLLGILKSDVLDSFLKEDGGELDEIKKTRDDLYRQIDEHQDTQDEVVNKILSCEFESPEAQTIYFLEDVVKSLKLDNALLRLTVELLQFQMKEHKAATAISNITDMGNEISIGYQNKILEHQTRELEHQRKKINQYKKGTKDKSVVSQQKWALARQYLIEEIPQHKILQDARRAAAKRAGIEAQDRRLIQMLPFKK